MGPGRLLRILPHELHPTELDLFNDLLRAQACVVRGQFAPQPAAQGVLD
jgi:hypothetical protein